MFLGLRGEIGIAIPLGVFGLGLLGWIPFGPAGFSQRTQKSAGQTSHVRSAYLEMELDHDSGEMRGHIVAGRHQGEALERLDVKTLAALLDEMDEESRALLVAYLDRRDPSWSEYAQGHAAAGRAAASSGKMTEQEAYQILGVQPGASADDIARAHRTLMKKMHPDQGGSTYLGRPHQRSQGNPFSPPSLRYSLRDTISGSWFGTSLLINFVFCLRIFSENRFPLFGIMR